MNDYKKNWNIHHDSRKGTSYPAQGLIRIMLGQYPSLPKIAKDGKSLDIGCGDGRNTVFLSNLGFDSWGVEITKSITDSLKLKIPTCNFELGTNSKLPFEDNCFDLVLGWNSIYYLGESFSSNELIKNLKETYRVLNKSNLDSTMIISVPCPSSFIFRKSKVIQIEDGVEIRQIADDPFGLRNGEYLATFNSKESMISVLNKIGYSQVSVGEEFGNWFGHTYDWWVAVCKI